MSVGVVTLVVANAGVAGCKSSADIAADTPPSGAASSAGGPGAPGTTTAPAEDPEVGFMGGSKAPAGGWAFPSKTAAQSASAAGPTPPAPSQTPPAQTGSSQSSPSKPPAKGASPGALPPPPNAPNVPVYQ